MRRMRLPALLVLVLILVLPWPASAEEDEPGFITASLGVVERVWQFLQAVPHFAALSGLATEEAPSQLDGGGTMDPNG